MTGRPSRRASAFLLTAAVTTCLAGCGGSVDVHLGDKSINVREMEATVRAGYAERTPFRLTSVSCEDAESRVGARISCKARNEKGLELEIGGRVHTVTDEEALFRWNIERAVAPGSVYAVPARRALETRFRERLRDLTCASRVVVRPGNQLRCTLTTRTGTVYGATVRLTNGDGGFHIQVDGKPQAGTPRAAAPQAGAAQAG